jgi:hypothetical protein
MSIVSRGDARPTNNVAAIFKQLSGDLKEQLDILAKVLALDLPAFNKEAARLKLDPVK